MWGRILIKISFISCPNPKYLTNTTSLSWQWDSRLLSPASVCVRNPTTWDSSSDLISTRGLGNDDFSSFAWDLNKNEHNTHYTMKTINMIHFRMTKKTVPFSPSTIQLILRAKVTKLLSFLSLLSSSSSASEKVRNLLISSWSSLASLTLAVWKSVKTMLVSGINIYLLVGLHRVNCHGVCQASDHDLFVFVGLSSPDPGCTDESTDCLVSCLRLNIFYFPLHFKTDWLLENIVRPKNKCLTLQLQYHNPIIQMNTPHLTHSDFSGKVARWEEKYFVIRYLQCQQNILW